MLFLVKKSNAKDLVLSMPNLRDDQRCYFQIDYLIYREASIIYALT